VAFKIDKGRRVQLVKGNRGERGKGTREFPGTARSIVSVVKLVVVGPFVD
jgi:hypothetical protein